ncbi:MAG: hypothetical protein QNJ38_09310 [Prochloraceae cyanobacterium]|nr:hypothetical protein [Prochloraceae cyanobacterium]
MKSKILLLLSQSKNTMLTITEIADRTNLEPSLVKQELIKLQALNCISSSNQKVEIKNCWFCITPKGERLIKSINDLVY